MTNTPEETLEGLLALGETDGLDWTAQDAIRFADATLDALPALRSLMEEVRVLRRVLPRVIEAAERALGDHEAPGDCFATGPLTGNAFADLVSCPGCVQINEIAEARAALSRLGGK